MNMIPVTPEWAQQAASDILYGPMSDEFDLVDENDDDYFTNDHDDERTALQGKMADIIAMAAGNVLFGDDDG